MLRRGSSALRGQRIVAELSAAERDGIVQRWSRFGIARDRAGDALMAGRAVCGASHVAPGEWSHVSRRLYFGTSRPELYRLLWV